MSAATGALLDVVRREPRLLGVTPPPTRWTLAALLAVVRDPAGPLAWTGLASLPGLARLLGRLHVHRKRGRGHIHSPDPLYQEKRASVSARLDRARLDHTQVEFARCAVRDAPATARRLAAPGIVTCFLDEVSYDRQPTLASAYEAAGRDLRTGHTHQPLAQLSLRGSTLTRVVGALDACTGRVIWHQGWKIGLKQLVAFYAQLRAAYPDAERLYVIQDNWPLHWHPDVLVALEPQETAWVPTRPASWSDYPSPGAIKRWGDWHLPIQLVFLPTYASWLNPIEKLWRKLRQDVLHLHRLAADLVQVREAVAAFLDQYAQPSALSDALLRYVGLHLPN